jgi:hypothetical protein
LTWVNGGAGDFFCFAVKTPDAKVLLRRSIRCHDDAKVRPDPALPKE